MSLFTNFQIVKDKIDDAKSWTDKILLHKPEYTLLEYIQSSGTQWIDLGYTGSTNIEFTIKYMEVNNTSSWKCLFGSRGSNSQTNHISYYYATDNSNLNTIMMGTSGNQTIYTPSTNNASSITTVNFKDNVLTFNQRFCHIYV